MSEITMGSSPLERHAPPFYVLSGEVVARLLESERSGVFAAVAAAYRLHASGDSVNPDSCFLRFSERPEARIIALPAYLGGSVDKAGVKWIASFPRNRERNLARASAILILNDYATGYPIACLEASQISAHRTAASAALGAEVLTAAGREGSLAVVGTGVIARTTVEWLLFREWRFSSVTLYDTDRREAERFAAWLSDRVAATVTVAARLVDATRSASLVLFATTAATPHVDQSEAFDRAPTVLHVSLRDLPVGHILAAQNIVDDIDHCLKARTSVHLTEIEVGHRRFIDGTLADVIAGRLTPEHSKPRIFSPFGLGVLDVAVGDHLFRKALADGLALPVPRFFAHATRW